VVKEVVHRPRPSEALVHMNNHLTDPSFPSGHALNSMLLYGFLFYLAMVYLRNIWLRLAVQAACLWLIIGNGLQRVYSGEHWTSDVLGGYLLGAIGVALLIAAHRLVILPREGVPYRKPARSQG
jgi:membrane-associated phospholipid phosphatase